MTQDAYRKKLSRKFARYLKARFAELGRELEAADYVRGETVMSKSAIVGDEAFTFSATVEREGDDSGAR